MMSRLGLNLPNLISLGRLLLVPLAISLIVDGRYWAATLSEPSGAFNAPHSPFAAGFDRLQSGEKLPFVSVHCRVAELIVVLT